MLIANFQTGGHFLLLYLFLCWHSLKYMKFVKKPIIVEAEQFWPDDDIFPESLGVYQNQLSSTGYSINTLEGEHEVTPGDWIITGIKGEKYPCKPDIFELTYEEVS